MASKAPTHCPIILGFIIRHHLGTKHHLITAADISTRVTEVPGERRGELCFSPVQGHFHIGIVGEKAFDRGDGDSGTTVTTHGIDC